MLIMEYKTFFLRMHWITSFVNISQEKKLTDQSAAGDENAMTRLKEVQYCLCFYFCILFFIVLFSMYISRTGVCRTGSYWCSIG